MQRASHLSARLRKPSRARQSLALPENTQTRENRLRLSLFLDWRIRLPFRCGLHRGGGWLQLMRYFHLMFFPRLMASLRLCARPQFQQFHPPSDHFHVVARSKLLRFRQEPMFLRGIKEEHPFEMLLPRQHEDDRLKMRIDEKQEGLVADRVALETEHVNRISAQQHSDAAHEWR